MTNTTPTTTNHALRSGHIPAMARSIQEELAAREELGLTEVHPDSIAAWLHANGQDLTRVESGLRRPDLAEVPVRATLSLQSQTYCGGEVLATFRYLREPGGTPSPRGAAYLVRDDSAYANWKRQHTEAIVTKAHPLSEVLHTPAPHVRYRVVQSG